MEVFMDVNKNEILAKAGIPEDQWEQCFISPEGSIYTPFNGRTGEEVYNADLNYVEPTPEPTTQDEINAMLMQEITELKARLQQYEQIPAN
jgi:hypothetical protein